MRRARFLLRALEGKRVLLALLSIAVALLLVGLGATLARLQAASTPPIAVASPQRVRPAPAEPSSTLELRPTFGPEPATVAPEVSALCDAFHVLPRVRRSECGAPKSPVRFDGECRRMLGGAVANQTVTLDGDQVAACLRATRQRYASCEFASARSLPQLDACKAVARGTLADGASCRSSLECKPGLHCHGVGPLDRGTCGAPKQAGEACGRAIDPLAAYVANDAETVHRECEGSCVNRRCRKPS